MTRLQMAGRWAQVVGAVLAWILLVPLFELVRAAAERLRLGHPTDVTTPVERPAGSRTTVASAGSRRAA